jgi:hypothetical protein
LYPELIEATELRPWRTTEGATPSSLGLEFLFGIIGPPLDVCVKRAMLVLVFYLSASPVSPEEERWEFPPSSSIITC